MYNRRMPDEQVDIVNEQDEVLYSTSKQEAHKIEHSLSPEIIKKLEAFTDGEKSYLPRYIG